MAGIDKQHFDCGNQRHVCHRFSAQINAQQMGMDSDLDASSIRGNSFLSFVLALDLSTQREVHPARANQHQHDV
jgi:hypothetical protein